MKREKQLRVRDPCLREPCLREATPGMRLVVKDATLLALLRGVGHLLKKSFGGLAQGNPFHQSVIMPRKMSLVLDESGGEKLGGGKYGDEALGDV